MPEHIFRVNSAEELNRSLEARSIAIQEAIAYAEIDSAFATQTAVQIDTREVDKVDTGLYRQSWQVTIGHDANSGVQLRNDAPYAGIIEMGARPHWAPIAPLIEWAKRNVAKLGIRGRSGRYRFSRLTNEEESEAIAAAYAIRAAIARRGLPPYRIMANRVPYAAEQLARAMRERFRELAGRRT